MHNHRNPLDIEDAVAIIGEFNEWFNGQGFAKPGTTNFDNYKNALPYDDHRFRPISGSQLHNFMVGGYAFYDLENDLLIFNHHDQNQARKFMYYAGAEHDELLFLSGEAMIFEADLERWGYHLHMNEEDEEQDT
jgi:hypothetical protein